MLLLLQYLIGYRAALFSVEGNYAEKWIPGDGTTGFRRLSWRLAITGRNI